MEMAEEIEAHIAGVKLPYRRLWLDSEHTISQIEIVLADALGLSASELPDALTLAEQAAALIRDGAREYA